MPRRDGVAERKLERGAVKSECAVNLARALRRSIVATSKGCWECAGGDSDHGSLILQLGSMSLSGAGRGGLHRTSFHIYTSRSMQWYLWRRQTALLAELAKPTACSQDRGYVL